MNQIHCKGNIARDAILKQGTYGPFMTFSLAVNTGYGEKQATMWYSCIIRGKRAEKVYPLFQKGRSVCLCADFSESEYVGNDGSKKVSKNLHVDRFDFISKNPSQSNPDQETPDNHGNAYELPLSGSDLEDECPF